MDKRYGNYSRFCRWFLLLGNPTEAALRAGSPHDSAEADGITWLHTPACRRILAKLAQEPPLPLNALVTAGLARLAFGNANDAAKLAFSESVSDETLRTLDLFHVTGIKRDKNGVEIKFADRLAAMEKLLECADNADHSAAAAALLHALQSPNDPEEVTANDPSETGSECAVFSETA